MASEALIMMLQVKLLKKFLFGCINNIKLLKNWFKSHKKSQCAKERKET